MYSLMWPWQKIPGGKRLIYETALHRALAFENTEGPRVTGNTQPYDSWPENFQDELFRMIKFWQVEFTYFSFFFSRTLESFEMLTAPSTVEIFSTYCA